MRLFGALLALFIVILAIVLGVAIAVESQAQMRIVDENTVVQTIHNPNGSITLGTFRYFADHFYKVGSTWREVELDWRDSSGRFEIRNGPNVVALDTATGVVSYRRGAHILRTKIVAAIYYDASKDSVHVLANASPSGFTRSARAAIKTAYFPGVTLRYETIRGGLKDVLTLSKAARGALPTPASLGLTTAQTWFGFVTEVWTDSLNLSPAAQGQVIDWINALETEGYVDFRDANDSVIFSFGSSIAWVSSNDADSTTQSSTVRLRSRFETRNGRKFVVMGAKVTDLAALPPGAITFDPPTVFAVTEDMYLRSAAANQHDDQTSNATWQLGWLAVPTYTAARDTLYPTGDHTPEMWSRSTGSDSWALLDETTPNTTDYISTTNQYDTTIVGYQDIAASLNVNFHVADSVLIAVHLRQFAGDNGYIAIIADTSGDGINNFFRVDSVLTTGTFATTTKRLGGEWSVTALDSLKIGVVSLWNPSTNAQVSWLVAIPFWQTVTADGDALHEIIDVPGGLARTPEVGRSICWDSVILYAYCPSGLIQADSNWHFRTYFTTWPDEDALSYTDWVHQWHTAHAWKGEGGTWPTQFMRESISNGDVFAAYHADSHYIFGGVNLDIFVRFKLPDTAGYSWWADSSELKRGILIRPDPRESGTSRRQLHSVQNSLDPYVVAWATYYPPKLYLSGTYDGDTLLGFSPIDLHVTLAKDTLDLALFDSVAVYRKYLGDSAWYAWLGYSGPMIGFGSNPPAIGAIEGLDYWDQLPASGVHVRGVVPNREGACSLMVAAYTSRGAGDTALLRVYIDSSLWFETDVQDIVHVDQNAPTFNFGKASEVRLGAGRNILIRATGMGAIDAPGGLRVINRQDLLRLYRKSGLAATRAVQTARLDSTAWQIGDNDSTLADAGEVTWNHLQYSSRPWVAPGGDYDLDSLTDTTVISWDTATSRFAYINVTDMRRGDSINCGVRDLNAYSTAINFHADTAANDTMHAAIITAYQLVAQASEPTVWSVARQVKHSRNDAGATAPGNLFTMTGFPGRPKAMIVATQVHSTTTLPASAYNQESWIGEAFLAESEAGMKVVSISRNHDYRDDGTGVAFTVTSARSTNQLTNFTDAKGGSLNVYHSALTADGWEYGIQGTTTFDQPAIVVSVFAIGGSDILDVDIGTVGTLRTAVTFQTQTVSVGASPFWEPDLVLWLYKAYSASATWDVNSSSPGGWGLCAFDGTRNYYTQNASLYFNTVPANNASTVSYCNIDKVIGLGSDLARNYECDFVGFLPTGFSYQQRRSSEDAPGTSGSYATFAWLAIRGGNWRLGVDSAQLFSQSATQTVTVSGFTNTPAGVLLFSTGMEDTVVSCDPSSAATDSSYWGWHSTIGAFDGASQWAAYSGSASGDGIYRENGLIDYYGWIGNDYSFGSSLEKPANMTWVQQSAEFFSVGAGEFSLFWADRMTVDASLYFWLALEGAGASPPASSRRRRLDVQYGTGD